MVLKNYENPLFSFKLSLFLENLDIFGIKVSESMSPSRLHSVQILRRCVQYLWCYMPKNILKRPPPELKTGGKFPKRGNSAMLVKRFWVVLINFMTIWNKKVREKKKKKKKITRWNYNVKN